MRFQTYDLMFSFSCMIVFHDGNDLLRGKVVADEIPPQIEHGIIEIKKKFGDERRTAIEEVENEILIEDLIERKDCVVTISHAGYIKRLPSDTYSAQRRGHARINTFLR